MELRWRIEYESIGKDIAGETKGWVAQMFLDRGGAEPIGYLTVAQLDESALNIESVWVLPSYRGQGIATGLFERVVAENPR